MAQEFQSTLPARGATRWFGRSPKTQDISIHAPRTGSDAAGEAFFRHLQISIHAPRTGSDQPATEPCASANIFQSTLPARGATRPQPADAHGSRFQSTLPARGATGPPGRTTALRSDFNPRSPHGERQPKPPPLRGLRNFNPRSPHGERHSIIDYQSAGFTISIHAPRTGSDVVVKVPICRAAEFQSTLPARGATSARAQLPLRPAHFNPRSPHGERPAQNYNKLYAA